MMYKGDKVGDDSGKNSIKQTQRHSVALSLTSISDYSDSVSAASNDEYSVNKESSNL